MSGDPTTAALSALEPRYEIIREIGRGGTALVYLARERSSGCEVAIKLIRAKYVEDEETLARFAREARYVGELHHPNVVGLRAVVELGDLGLALVMDHVSGQTLKQLIQESGPLSPAQAEAVLRDIAGALGSAHAMGIVHRDVKPENIFIDSTGRAMLADFGVARSMTSDTQLTMSGIAIGTPAYMAPEQIDGIVLDGRGDIYSLGLVGWEMLTGRRPWEGLSLYAVIYQQKHEELPDVREMRPGIPDRLADTIASAIEKDRALRWQNVDEFIAALDGAATRRAQRPRPVVENQTRRFLRPTTSHNAETPDPSAAVQDVLAAISTSEFSDRDPPTMVRRLVIGGGVAVGLVVLGIAWSISQGRTSVLGRATGEVVFATPAGSPRPTSARSLAVVDSSRRSDSAVATRSVPAIGPAPVVARTTSEPSLALLQRSTSAGQVVRDATEDTVEASPSPAKPSPRPDSTRAAPVASNENPPMPPMPVRPRATAPTTRVSIATGGAHSCLVVAGGQVFCWGGNDQGQLGSGNTTRLASPAAIATGLRFTEVAPGLSHSCAVTSGGAAWCWGENRNGQLGDRSFASRLTPVPVADNHNFRSVAAGAAHSCGVDNDGKIWCWGSNTRGQLGAGGGSDASPTPIAVAADRRYVNMALGWSFSCAVDAAGSAMCWGENGSGQLGDGTREDRDKPVLVRASAPFTVLTAGSGHACGLTAAGEAYCWGRNSRGQLGDGTKTDQTTPVRVKTTARFVAISAGAVHTCAVSSDGAAYCWGQNTYGQLGDGGTTDHTEPVAVVGDHAFASVRAFGSHTCAATASGEAFCWGYNLDGQLGDGTRVHRTRPVYVEPPSGR